MQLFFVLLGIFFSGSSYGKTICFAHRGGGWNYFDNSLSAIKGAIEQKYEGVEIDLHQTKDGQIILLHDDNFEKVSPGSQCLNDRLVRELSWLEIEANCLLKNGEKVGTLGQAFDLLRGTELLIILDLKDQLSDSSIKFILESGIAPERLRLSAFYHEFLKLKADSAILSKEQIQNWNSIPRYENFRHPVFSQTQFGKNFHLFSALTYGIVSREDKNFGAWEVNYSVFLRWILPLKPAYVITKNPKECMRIRDDML